MRIHHTCKYLVLAVSTFAISACEIDKRTSVEDSVVESSAISNFDPANSVIPFPNDLLFSGSTDGTLNIPVADATNLADPQVALSGADGSSTVAPMSTGFTGAISSSSINGDSVKLYQVTLSSAPAPGGAAVAVNTQLTYGVDYIASISSVDSSSSTLVIVPLKPLMPKSSYYVAITNNLRSADGKRMGMSGAYAYAKLTSPLVDAQGNSVTAALPNESAQALEPLRQLISTSEATASASDANLSTTDIIVSWTFTTQSVNDVLTQVRTNIRAGAVPSSTLAMAPAGLSDSPLGAADIYLGTVDVPYYLTAASGVNDPAPLGSFWQGPGNSHLTYLGPNLSPVATSTQTIPVMVSIPKGTATNHPVLIYQHGITTNRATMLAIADAMASAGIAVVAIDMPLHGLTGNEGDGTENYRSSGNERTFDLDLVTQDANGNITASTPDGTTDSSGSHFINLSNLMNSRDNVRQSVSDLFALTYALDNMQAGSHSFDTSRIYFLGHSLGAIVGTPFAALEPSVRDVAFAFGGGSIPKILDGSSRFSPTIAAGLAANGVNKGTADYESFIGVAQTLLDSGDPVNYATSLAAKDQGIVYFEIVGGNTSPSDLVVPNTVPDSNDTSNTVPAPLAGTEPLLTLMGLTPVSSDAQGNNLRHSVKFVVGNHASLLSAAADNVNSATTNAAVRTEIQTIIATFLATDGNTVNVTDSALLQPSRQL